MALINRNATAQNFAARYPPKARWTTLRLLVAHMTETSGWPGYDGGAKAPNRTLRPDFARKALDVREHFPANAASRALRNEAGGGETNAAPGGVHQWEIVGTCSRETSRKWQRQGLRPGVDYLEAWNVPGWLLDAFASEWVDLHRRYGLPLELGSTDWPAYPSSPEADRRARMSRAEFERARGLIGHLHVPENTHLDPGDFPAQDLLRRALALAGGRPAPAPNPQEDDVELTDPVPLGPGNRIRLGRVLGRTVPPGEKVTLMDLLLVGLTAGEQLGQVRQQVTNLTAQVQKLSEVGKVDPDVLAEVRRALDGLRVTATLDADG